MLEKNELVADLEFMKIGEPDGAYDLANDLNSARKKDLISALYENASQWLDGFVTEHY